MLRNFELKTGGEIRGQYKSNLQVRRLFSTSETIATLVNYTCKSFIELTPGLNIVFVQRA